MEGKVKEVEVSTTACTHKHKGQKGKKGGEVRASQRHSAGPMDPCRNLRNPMNPCGLRTDLHEVLLHFLGVPTHLPGSLCIPPMDPCASPLWIPVHPPTGP